MNILTTSILDIISPLLGDDIIAFHLSYHKNEVNEVTKNTLERLRGNFSRYLISVATHSLGLGPSLTPFNCNQEQMIAYIMDMFDVSKKRIPEILGQTNGPKNQREEVIPTPVKRHQWRPELRIRIGTPMFFSREPGYLERLRIRLYSMKSNQTNTGAKHPAKGSDQKLNQIFQKLIEKLRKKPNFYVRHPSEMVTQIQFEQDKNRSSNYITVRLHKDNKTVGDLYLPIRRYYCDRETSHTIRFEFWIEKKHIDANEHYSWNRVFGILRPSPKREKSESFIGYISIDLTDVPSYAYKQTYPVLNSRDKKVTNCDITIEPKNRRLDSNMTNSNLLDYNSKLEATRLKFIINHIRLQANCLLYQSLLVAKVSQGAEFSSHQLSIDNLLYLPAYSLINQHRLQSNLSFFDDTSLRRSSMLLLLIQLECKKLDCEFRNILSVVKLVLLTVLKNEYLTTYQLIDNRTMQEANPFRDRLADNPVTLIVTELESASFREFISRVLTRYLKDWFVSAAEVPDPQKFSSERTMTLICLRLCRLALEHLCDMSHRMISKKLRQDLITQKGMIEQLLCEIFLNYIIASIQKLLVDPSSIEHPDGTNASDPSNLNWSSILSCVRTINNDIRTHWSRKGLRGLMRRHRGFLENSKLLERLYQNEMTSLIMSKVDNYMS